MKPLANLIVKDTLVSVLKRRLAIVVGISSLLFATFACQAYGTELYSISQSSSSDDLKISGKLRSALYFEKIDLKVDEIITIQRGVVTIRNANLEQSALEKIVTLSKQIAEVSEVKVI
jgi:hypothetical protein